METMRIGEFARKAGVNVQTVRYYERRGLLPEPERRESGYREYTPDCLERLQFIRRSQELGFTFGGALVSVGRAARRRQRIDP